MDWQFFVGTLPLASMYFLLGLSFVLIYRTSRVVNFAAGELAVLAPYLLLALPQLGIAFLPGLALASWLMVGLVGACLFLVGLRAMTGQSPVPAILATFAAAIVLRAIIELVWTSQPKFILAGLGVRLAPVRWGPIEGLTWADIGVVPAAALVALAIAALLRFSVLGVRTRAVAESQELAGHRGVNVYATLGGAWLLAAIAAGIAGTYYALAVRLSPSVAVYGLRALTVPLLGGLDSVWGALLASLAVALVERASVRFGDPLLGDVAPFALLLAALWIRPWGLFGRPEQVERV
ncbi:MAG: hypothetical protein NZ949_04775 [Candidatus Kapabacteria bacterium]|nr:hypothetical protein [Candidatus Kapabacteria bacterium]